MIEMDGGFHCNGKAAIVVSVAKFHLHLWVVRNHSRTPAQQFVFGKGVLVKSDTFVSILAKSCTQSDLCLPLFLACECYGETILAAALKKCHITVVHLL